MSLIFSALEIGRGDAFLLQDRDSDWNCLVDSGASQKRIVDILKKKIINKINVAICTHNDIDHAKGFIGLLNSDIKIEEIWLPGNWASIIQYIKENEYVIHEISWSLITDVKKSIDKINSKEQQEKTIAFDSLFDDKNISIEHFLANLDIDKIDIIDDYQREITRCKSKSCAILYKQIFFKMNRIIEIAKQTKKQGCRIRWFSPNNGKINKIDNHFVALNSEEITHVKLLRDTKVFYTVLFLSCENEYSLVFEYLLDDDPIIRFSADSNCTNQSSPTYTNNIIVTAPHHGSESNANVYSSIKGKDIIWVRSDQKDRFRPCAAFKQIQGNKYCLACNQLNFKSEVSFKFSQGKWICLKGYACNC